jgi:uncharacterized OB-fold protein
VSALELPVCEACGTVQYPVREVCMRCLSDRLRRQSLKMGGVILASTVLHRSMDTRFAPHLPLAIGSVKLDAGPVAIAVLDAELASGARVQVRAMPGPEGRTVLHASAE